MMKLLVLAVAFAAVHADGNQAFVENPGDGSVKMWSAAGKDVVIAPGKDASVKINNVMFSMADVKALKMIVGGKRPVAQMGNALKGDTAGITVRDDSAFVGAKKLFFTAPVEKKVQEETDNGQRQWTPKELSINIGDTVTWSWVSVENVLQVDEDGSRVSGGIKSGDQSNGGTFSSTFMRPGTFYFKSENTASMTMTITVTENSVTRDTVKLNGLSVTGDVSIDGSLVSKSLADAFDTSIEDWKSEQMAKLNGVIFGTDGANFNQVMGRTYEIRTSTYHGNGWRCRDPHCNCNNGKYLIGGGCRTNCHGSSRDQGLAETYAESNGWRCRGDVYHQMTAFCICV